jgi:hypothetical protein
VRSRERAGDRWTLEVDQGRLGAVVTAVEAKGGRVLGVHPIRQTLEEYFVKEMGSMGRSETWD